MNNKAMKTIFLPIVILLLIVDSSVFAYSGGNGLTEQTPYLISSKADMEELATAVNGGNSYSGKYFLLTRDLTGVETITAVIGNSEECYFSGIFDGGGNEIACGISITESDNQNKLYAGIFGYISGATIKNLGVNGSVFSSYHSSYNSYSRSGSICGCMIYWNISNCYNTGYIDASDSTAAASGGICGYMIYGNISNCYNIGNITAISRYSYPDSGGICGRMDGGTISNCFSANTSITGMRAGRIWGARYLEATVENCHALASMLVNGETKSSQDASSQAGKDAELSDFQSQDWIVENLNWDFNAIWEMSDVNSFHQGLPILKNNTGTAIPVIGINRSDAVSVYPNPATNDLYITAEYPIEKVELYNSSGALLRLETNVTDRIDVSALGEGLYLAWIYSGNQVVIRKVIVRK